MKAYRGRGGTSTYSEPQHEMEVSCQHHAPAVLPPGKRHGIHWVGRWVGPTAIVVATNKTNALASQGCEPRTDQAVDLSPCRKQMNNRICVGEISHTCGIWDDSNLELAHRFKFRCTTGMFLLAKGRNCNCGSVVGCVRYVTKCGILYLAT